MASLTNSFNLGLSPPLCLNSKLSITLFDFYHNLQLFSSLLFCFLYISLSSAYASWAETWYVLIPALSQHLKLWLEHVRFLINICEMNNPWLKPGGGMLPVCVNKVLLEVNHIHCSSVICDWLHSPTAEYGSCSKNYMLHKAKIINDQTIYWRPLFKSRLSIKLSDPSI